MNFRQNKLLDSIKLKLRRKLLLKLIKLRSAVLYNKENQQLNIQRKLHRYDEIGSVFPSFKRLSTMAAELKGTLNSSLVLLLL